MIDKYNLTAERLWEKLEFHRDKIDTTCVDFNEPFLIDQLIKRNGFVSYLIREVENEFNYSMSESQCSWAVNKFMKTKGKRIMNFNEYQQLALRTASTLDNDKLILNGALGLAGESGEVADLIKKHLFQGHELNKAKIKDELSDIMWYIAIMAKGIGIELDEVPTHNVEKLKKRYPNGFEAERSINRAEEKSE